MIKTPPIASQTWRWAITWSLAILTVSCLPYLIAYFMAPPGWQFAGLLVNPYDGHSYLAKMRQGVEGNWLFQLTYTPEPHQGAFIFTFYLALGHLARLTHLPLILIFHLARLAAGLCLLLAAFRFITKVTSDTGEQRLAFLLLLTSSGLGWLGVLFGAFPIDLWIPEAFVPYSLYANPHFPLGMALMLLILQSIVWPNSSKPPSPHSLSPIPYPLSLIPYSLFLALVLPFALLTVWAVLAVYLLWLYGSIRRLPWLQIWLTLAVGLASAPLIFYMYWVARTNPILAGWNVQNLTPAPSLLNFWWGYGLLGVLALLGGGLVLKQKQVEARGEWLVLIWAVVTIVLVYLPFDLQRRFINGLHLPLAILAALGLRRGLARASLKRRYHGRLQLAVIGLGLLGTLFVWVLPLIGASQSPDVSPATALLFERQAEIAALDWLDEHTGPDSVILASPRLGLFVPERTGARAFYGHPFETVAAGQKKAMVEAFYRGEIDSLSPPAGFVIYGPSEQAIGRPRQLANYPVLFATETVIIYKLENNPDR